MHVLAHESLSHNHSFMMHQIQIIMCGSCASELIALSIFIRFLWEGCVPIAEGAIQRCLQDVLVCTAGVLQNISAPSELHCRSVRYRQERQCAHFHRGEHERQRAAWASQRYETLEL